MMRSDPTTNGLAPLCLGTAPYLNMIPLITGLEGFKRRGLTMRYGPPSRLARWLEAGRIDIAMVSVGAILNHPEWSVAPGTMIGSRGAVKSVIIAGLGKPGQWRALRPDAHSRTGNALARVLTESYLGLELEPGRALAMNEPEPSDFLKPGEAMVLIGSRALRSWAPLRQRGATILDMGSLWRRWTGLPFVFALWAIRPGAVVDGWLGKLEETKQRNFGRIGKIAKEWPGLEFDRMSARQAADYLRRNVDYDFDAEAKKAVARFYREGRKLGLFAEGWKLKVVGERVARL